MVEWWKGMVERWNLMALNIKNEETERIVREREKVEGERTVQPSRLKRSDYLQAFAREFSKRVKNPIHSWEIDALLYDKDGLPK
jgi:hypothetical protein